MPRRHINISLILLCVGLLLVLARGFALRTSQFRQREESAARVFAQELASSGRVWVLVGRDTEGNKVVCRLVELRSTKQYQFELRRGYYLSDVYLQMKPYQRFGLAYVLPPHSVRVEARPEYYLVPTEVSHQ